VFYGQNFGQLGTLTDVEVRIKKVEEQAKEANDKADAVRKQREKESVSESKKNMANLFRLSEKQI
jgi:lipid II:glycine glycyltransferase (peptidoglycan interpeptide bridge formation enzyme)